MNNDPEVTLPSNEAPSEQDLIDRAIAMTHAVMMCGNSLPVAMEMTVSEIHAVACDAMGVDVSGQSDDYIRGRFDALRESGRVLPRHDPIPMPRPKR